MAPNIRLLVLAALVGHITAQIRDTRGNIIGGAVRRLQESQATNTGLKSVVSSADTSSSVVSQTSALGSDSTDKSSAISQTSNVASTGTDTSKVVQGTNAVGPANTDTSSVISQTSAVGSDNTKTSNIVQGTSAVSPANADTGKEGPLLSGGVLTGTIVTGSLVGGDGTSGVVPSSKIDNSNTDVAITGGINDGKVVYDISTQSECKQVSNPATNDCTWVAGLGQKRGWYDMTQKGRVIAYQILQSNGRYSKWYVPGVNDLDTDYNINSTPCKTVPIQANTMRRMWAKFYDHQHRYIVCNEL